jgi:hypothetical protein
MSDPADLARKDIAKMAEPRPARESIERHEAIEARPVARSDGMMAAQASHQGDGSTELK